MSISQPVLLEPARRGGLPRRPSIVFCKAGGQRLTIAAAHCESSSSPSRHTARHAAAAVTGGSCDQRRA